MRLIVSPSTRAMNHPVASLTAAYALEGNDGRAQSEKVKLLAQWPDASIAPFNANRISDVPEPGRKCLEKE